MAATDAQVTRLRRMVAEADDSNGYTGDVLKEAIERYPLIDADGYAPGDANWTAVYDLNAAAAEIWTEKAGARFENMAFTADGSTFHKEQQYNNALKMARHYNARRAPGAIQLMVEPGPIEEEE